MNLTSMKEGDIRSFLQRSKFSQNEIDRIMAHRLIKEILQSQKGVSIVDLCAAIVKYMNER
jgi:hypothetical protein